MKRFFSAHKITKNPIQSTFMFFGFCETAQLGDFMVIESSKSSPFNKVFTDYLAVFLTKTSIPMAIACIVSSMPGSKLLIREIMLILNAGQYITTDGNGGYL
jgi:hypothetical protein